MDPDYRCVEELAHILGARPMGQTDMGGGFECIRVGILELHHDSKATDRTTALPRATFPWVIPGAFMLVSLVSQRKLGSPGVYKSRAMTCLV